MHPSLRCTPAPGHPADLGVQLKPSKATLTSSMAALCLHAVILLLFCSLASVLSCLRGVFVSHDTHMFWP